MASTGIAQKLMGIGVCALLVAVVPTATADLSDALFCFEVCNDDGCEAYCEIMSDDPRGHWEGSVWILDQNIEFISGRDEVIATLYTDFEGYGTTLGFNDDPAVSLGFALQAEDSDTEFTISSAMLSFPEISNAEGQASAAFTLMRFNEIGPAVLGGLCPEGGAYLAQYNGFVPNGTTFADEVNQIVVPQDEFLTAVDVEVPGGGMFAPIGTASDMSIQFHFSLTANDFASGSGNFTITPEPSGLLLLLASVALIRRR
ncbi:MAG: hypothetical protein PVJ57_05540 [Phycisphaerae bacterium]|jgi:hypothetical protein